MYADRTSDCWLMAIGDRLRAEYKDIELPLPERLAALLEQLNDAGATLSEPVTSRSI